MTKLTAPQVDNYIKKPHNSSSAVDKTSLTLTNALYLESEKIVPCGDDNRHELWLCADRGTIDDLGDLVLRYTWR